MANLTIQGHAFNLDDKYEEGHVLAANEASALNGLRGENLRNNFASTVSKAKETAGEGNEPDWDALQVEFDKIASEYEFGARRGGGRVTDPVQREANRIAREKVEGALREKYGTKWDEQVSKDNFNELVAKFAAREDVQALAAANVAAASNLGLGDIEV